MYCVREGGQLVAGRLAVRRDVAVEVVDVQVPLTTVPAAADGVMVTLIVAVWPGLMTTGENGGAG